MSKRLKILIPHDLKNNFLNLIPLINAFEAKSKFSEICLYHAYEPPHLLGKNLPETMKDLVEDDEKNIAKSLKTQASIFQSLIKSDTKVKTVFKRNKPIPGIKNFAKKYKPDIIMMTTQRQNLITKFINTSNALKMFNAVDAPILIMPREYQVTKDLRLNFLIQFFENVELAKTLSQGIDKIFDKTRFLHRDPTLAEKSTKEVKVVASIQDYIQDSKYDEIFMLIRKKKNPLQKALTTGFVDRLIGINQAPVIIINE